MSDTFEDDEVYDWFGEHGYDSQVYDFDELILITDLPKILRDWEEYREMKGAL